MAIQLGRINIVTYLSALYTPTPELVDRAILNKQYDIMHVLHQHMSNKNYHTARNDSNATRILKAYQRKKQSASSLNGCISARRASCTEGKKLILYTMDHRALKLGGEITPLIIRYLDPEETALIGQYMTHVLRAPPSHYFLWQLLNSYKK